MARMLIENGSNIFSMDYDGISPLQLWSRYPSIPQSFEGELLFVQLCHISDDNVDLIYKCVHPSDRTHLLLDGQWSDLEFQVGAELIVFKAHKVILYHRQR